MKHLILFLISLFFTFGLSGQVSDNLPVTKTKVMTLGVFHFAYPNLDVVTTDKKNQISVLEEPYQSEIIAITKSLQEFNPTIIAIEMTPDRQERIDSLFRLYKSDKFTLGKDEVDQLAFRLGKDLNLNRIVCVNDFGKHYDDIMAIFNDTLRAAKFEEYFLKSRETGAGLTQKREKVSGIIDELYEINRPDAIKEDLAVYLSNPFKYEEQSGDFTGADFETGRWFNRNLRIFRNIQRIPHTSDDRILLIIGAGHLNLLNFYFDVSNEFEFVSPLPYLESAKNN